MVDIKALEEYFSRGKLNCWLLSDLSQTYNITEAEYYLTTDVSSEEEVVFVLMNAEPGDYTQFGVGKTIAECLRSHIIRQQMELFLEETK